jgi:hypothetical protein
VTARPTALLSARLGSACALVGLALSLVVHGSSYLSSPPSWPAVPFGALHVSALLLFGVAVLLARRAGVALNGREARQMLSAAATIVPAWLTALVGLTFVYAVVNFLLFFAQSTRGVPEKSGGRYVLDNHGQFTTVSQQTYEHTQALLWRGFSGHWLLFYLLTAVIFWYTPRLQASREGGGAS